MQESNCAKSLLSRPTNAQRTYKQYFLHRKYLRHIKYCFYIYVSHLLVLIINCTRCTVHAPKKKCTKNVDKKNFGVYGRKSERGKTKRGKYHKGRRKRINLYCKYEHMHLACSTPVHLQCKSVYVTWPTNARLYPVFIT